LAAERAALTGDTPDAVHETAAEKIRLLGVIEALESERRALWGPAEPHAPGIAGAVAERWRALMQLMAGCRTANEVNGHIIHIRQNQIRQLVDIVRGGAPVTYGPQGKTFSRALRALARA
jgi:flagellar biosynthesis/type III secretory pathway chaperone